MEKHYQRSSAAKASAQVQNIVGDQILFDKVGEKNNGAIDCVGKKKANSIGNQLSSLYEGMEIVNEVSDCSSESDDEEGEIFLELEDEASFDEMISSESEEEEEIQYLESSEEENKSEEEIVVKYNKRTRKEIVVSDSDDEGK